MGPGSWQHQRVPLAQPDPDASRCSVPKKGAALHRQSEFESCKTDLTHQAARLARTYVSRNRRKQARAKLQQGMLPTPSPIAACSAASDSPCSGSTSAACFPVPRSILSSELCSGKPCKQALAPGWQS